jgi:hypothetical protein
MPDTPEPSYSELTSPASSVSPQTLVGMINDTVKIVSCESYPGLSIVEQAALDFAVMKQKMFAFAAPHLFGILPHTPHSQLAHRHQYLIP